MKVRREVYINMSDITEKRVMDRCYCHSMDIVDDTLRLNVCTKKDGTLNTIEIPMHLIVRVVEEYSTLCGYKRYMEERFPTA